LKLFFMHIPKTAGTSFRRFLERSVRDRGGAVSERTRDGIWSDLSESYASYDEFVASGGRPWRDSELVSGHYPYHVMDLLEPGTVVVTVLRDTFARTLSLVKHQMALEQQQGSPTGTDVNDFLSKPRNEMFLQTIANLVVKYFSSTAHPDAVVPPEDLSLDLAVERCCRSLFGFAHELPAFQNRLSSGVFGGSPTGFVLARENASSDPFSAADLSNRNRELLREMNELDLQLEELMGRVLAARCGRSFKLGNGLAERF
jgi:hypothetical protein